MIYVMLQVGPMIIETRHLLFSAHVSIFGDVD